MLVKCAKQTVAVLKYARLMPLYATHDQMGDAARGRHNWSHLILQDEIVIAPATAALLDLIVSKHTLCPVITL